LQHRFPRVVKKEYLDRTHAFFEKYGGKTIIIARFVPIVRTFAPFVAGAGEMSYRRFMVYNITGGILWVLLCGLAGYFFGNMPIRSEEFLFGHSGHHRGLRCFRRSSKSCASGAGGKARS
jgi:membrane-associated protein